MNLVENQAHASPDFSTDPARQEQAKAYARTSRRLMLVDFILGGLYVCAWLVFGWSSALRDFLFQWTTNEWLLVAGFGIIFFGLAGLLSLPMTYYEGYVLPHRFGLSHQSLGSWFLDRLKGGVIAAVFGIFFLELIYWLLRLSPQYWWLWVGIFLLLFNVLLANLAPVILFPIFNKFSPLEEEHADLVDRLRSLAENAGTGVRGVFRFDMSRRTSTANAALTGLGNTRRILLSDTLLQDYSYDQIETILAHELGHHVHKDLPLGILFESAVTLLGLWLSSLVLEWGGEALGFADPADIANLPLLVIAISVFGLFTMPLSNAFSRWREFRADEYAVQVTGKAAEFAAALVRLADQNLLVADPERWVVVLFYSHPPVKDRVQRVLSSFPAEI